MKWLEHMMDSKVFPDFQPRFRARSWLQMPAGWARVPFAALRTCGTGATLASMPLMSSMPQMSCPSKQTCDHVPVTTPTLCLGITWEMPAHPCCAHCLIIQTPSCCWGGTFIFQH